MITSQVKVYRASDEMSYNYLCSRIFEGNCIATLNPMSKVIIVHSSNEVFDELDSFILKEELNFETEVLDHSTMDAKDLLENPFTPAHMLREIARHLKIVNESIDNKNTELCEACDTLNIQLEKAKKDSDTYSRYWLDEKKESDRVKKQVEAIATLMNSIYPS